MQRKIDTPGINSHAKDWPGGNRQRFPQTDLEFLEETVDIPVQMAQDSDRTVGESVNFLERELSSFYGSKHGSTAFGTEIEG
jgi:hypothetical protein